MQGRDAPRTAPHEPPTGPLWWDVTAAAAAAPTGQRPSRRDCEGDRRASRSRVDNDTAKAAAVLDVQFNESKSGGHIDSKLDGTSGWATERPDQRSADAHAQVGLDSRGASRASLATADREGPSR